MLVMPRSQFGKSPLRLFVCENFFAHNIHPYLLLKFFTKSIGNNKKSKSLGAMKEILGFEAYSKGLRNSEIESA